MNTNNELWIALISSIGGIVTALGLGKLVPYLIEQHKKNKELKEARYNETVSKIENLTQRLDDVEKELAKEKGVNQRTQSILRSMLPLMRSMMNDVPAHVALLDQLEQNVFGEITPPDETNR